MQGENKHLVKSIDTYGQNVSIHSIKAVSALEKISGPLNDLDVGVLSMQFVGFNSILFIRKLSENDYPISDAVRNLDSVLKVVTKRIYSSGQINPEDAYTTLRAEITDLIKEYANLPVVTPSDKKGLEGTLLWEYSKSIAKTIDREDDMIVVLSIADLLGDMSKSTYLKRAIDAIVGAKATRHSHLNWYWLSSAGALLLILGSSVEQYVGELAWFFISLGGFIFLLFSLASAASTGIRIGVSDSARPTLGSRVGAFLFALLIALFSLGIWGSLSA